MHNPWVNLWLFPALLYCWYVSDSWICSTLDLTSLELIFYINYFYWKCFSCSQPRAAYFRKLGRGFLADPKVLLIRRLIILVVHFNNTLRIVCFWWFVQYMLSMLDQILRILMIVLLSTFKYKIYTLAKSAKIHWLMQRPRFEHFIFN